MFSWSCNKVFQQSPGMLVYFANSSYPNMYLFSFSISCKHCKTTRRNLKILLFLFHAWITGGTAVQEWVSHASRHSRGSGDRCPLRQRVFQLSSAAAHPPAPWPSHCHGYLLLHPFRELDSGEGSLEIWSELRWSRFDICHFIVRVYYVTARSLPTGEQDLSSRPSQRCRATAAEHGNGSDPGTHHVLVTVFKK